jgi:long-chain acyl-CoA synthetase
MNIANWLDESGLRFPKRPALFEGQQVANYGAFVALVRHRAAYLIDEHAIAPGDRVALFMKNFCKYLELLYAIWWAGSVAVPINCKLHPVEAGWIVRNAQARLLYTSSTTDGIKGVMLSHGYPDGHVTGLFARRRSARRR